MIQLNIAENLVKLRHKKKVTQDEVATFLGVTKASVSKWENKQSYPDILLLPQLAAYFDVGIDELLGYEPQLSKEQAKKIYLTLANDFSELPFDEVMEKSKILVKEYYSCYSFLFLIVILWMNHFTLAPQEKQKDILQDILDVCHHIECDCTDVSICKNIQAIKGMLYLQLHELKQVIEILAPLEDDMHMDMDTKGCLIQAYAGMGEQKKAVLYSQIAVYQDILQTISHSMLLLSLHMQDTSYGEKTIQRISALIELYEIDLLNPNSASQFYYQAALFYMLQQQKEKALEYLQRFVETCERIFAQGIQLHGDAYFNHLDEWIADWPLGAEGVRNGKLILDTIIQALENPMLEPLKQETSYQVLMDRVKRRREQKL